MSYKEHLDALNQQPLLDSTNTVIIEENNSWIETDNSKAVWFYFYFEFIF
jgi:hypothetical protein